MQQTEVFKHPLHPIEDPIAFSILLYISWKIDHFAQKFSSRFCRKWKQGTGLYHSDMYNYHFDTQILPFFWPDHPHPNLLHLSSLLFITACHLISSPSPVAFHPYNLAFPNFHPKSWIHFLYLNSKYPALQKEFLMH